MKKIMFLFITILIAIPFSIFSAESLIFIETVAGSMKVRGEKIGVISTSSFGGSSKGGASAADDPVANYLRLELINKGAIIKILNPQGIDQLLGQFIEIKKGQFSTKESLAADASTNFKIALANKTDVNSGIQLFDKILNITELSGETDRMNEYSSLYKKFLDLWDIDKLITVTRMGPYSLVVKGYELNSPSATLIFQYEVKATSSTWSKIPQWKEDWKISGSYGYTIEESADVKYDASFKRTIEIVKRISEFLKDTGK